MSKLQIIVGSDSEHKVGAWFDACAFLGIDAHVWGVPKRIPGYPEQPFGITETLFGATERATNMAKHAEIMWKDGDLFVGSESGLIPAGDEFVLDIAINVIRAHGKTINVSTSPGMMFPRSAVEEAQRLGFDTTTAGKVIAWRLGGYHTDPQFTLSGGKCPRKSLLTQGAIVALSTIHHLSTHDLLTYPPYKKVVL